MRKSTDPEDDMVILGQDESFGVYSGSLDESADIMIEPVETAGRLGTFGAGAMASSRNQASTAGTKHETRKNQTKAKFSTEQNLQIGQRILETNSPDYEHQVLASSESP